jgi:hypothetical protein
MIMSVSPNEKQEALQRHREMLSEIHPLLPAYFCGTGSRIYPIPIGEKAEEIMKRHKLVRFHPNGHVDIDVLAAIYELFEYEEQKILYNPYIPFFTEKVLRKALGDPISELSQALAKICG